MEIRKFSGAVSLPTLCVGLGYRAQAWPTTSLPAEMSALMFLFLDSVTKLLGLALSCCVACVGLELVTLLLAAF